MILSVNKNSLRRMVLLAGMLFLMLIPRAGYGAEENLQSVELADYTSDYGWERSTNLQPIKVNPAKRSAVPLTTQYLAVFVEFPDEELQKVSLADEKVLENADILMNTGKGTMTSTGYVQHTITSFKEYVQRYTYGKLSVTTSFFPKDQSGKVVSHISSKSRDYYRPYSSTNTAGYKNDREKGDRERQLIEEAFNAVKSSVETAFSGADLDVNNDGYIDGISFFTENTDKTPAGWSELLWSHKADASSFGCTLSGKKLGPYNLINTILYPENPDIAGSVFSLNRSKYSTIIHEYLHTLGLPDLYRCNYADTHPVGDYDLMASTGNSNPLGLLSYMTSEYSDLRWNTPPQEITSSQTVTLYKPTYENPNEKRAVKIVSPYSDKEFFIAEFYDNEVNGVKELPIYKKGLLLYRINTAVGSTNMEGDTSGEKDYLYVFRPNEPSKGYGKGDLGSAALGKETGRLKLGSSNIAAQWNNDTLYYADGSNSGIVVEVKEETEDTITFDIKIPVVNGDGTKENPYMISRADDLALLSAKTDGYFRLNQDLNLQNAGAFRTVDSFGGVFDGNGHTIYNMQIKGADGMFSSVTPGAEIKNLKFSNISVTGDMGHTGSVAGAVYGTLTNVHVLSGSISSDMQQNNSFNGTGGLTGTLGESGILQNCISSAQVTGTQNTGGLIGLNQNGTIKGCYANGKVSGETSSGGIVGTQTFWGSSSYKMPQDVLFDMEKTGQTKGAGQVSGQAPEGFKGDEGLIGCRIEKSFALDLYKKPTSPIVVVTSPAGVKVPYTVQTDSPKTVLYNSAQQKLTAKGVGTAKIQVFLGAMKMPLAATVTVVDTKVYEKPQSPQEQEKTKAYRITYRLNGGKNHRANPISYTNKSVVLKNPTRSKYLFKGWYTDSNCRNKITSIKANAAKDYVLYAKWEKVKISKVSGLRVKNSGKRKLKVSYKKVKGASGYQIVYGKNKKMTKGKKTVTVSKTSRTLSKLKRGTTYYVKVRAYKKDSKGAKVYGAYSKTGKVKIKRQ